MAGKSLADASKFLILRRFFLTIHSDNPGTQIIAIIEWAITEYGSTISEAFKLDIEVEQVDLIFKV